MLLEIIKYESKLLLKYAPDNGIEWIDKGFEEGKEIPVKNTFFVAQKDLFDFDTDYDENIFADIDEDDNDCKIFIIGHLDTDYYVIPKNILKTEFDVLVHFACSIKTNYFITNSKFSIINHLESLAKQQIIIGGDKENAIIENIYEDIIDSFPNYREITLYRESRITHILTQYLEGVKDSKNAFEKYLERRKKIKAINSLLSIRSYEYDKYLFILENLKDMLKNSENFSEGDWQKQILEIILILYPKYIRCFSEVEIKDYYSNFGKYINRYIDLMLVDSNGNVDVIEIKKPFDNCVITKNTYRDNYTPLKELSGTIMQIEKYVFHLNKWGVVGELKLSAYFKDKLPKDLTIKITNPKGIIILGRDNNLNKTQKFDFEIIKRKYSNVMDIITYDDLIRRIENVLSKFTSN